MINAGGDLTLAQATNTHTESQHSVNGSANLKVGTTPDSKNYGGGFNAGGANHQKIRQPHKWVQLMALKVSN